MSQRWRRIVVTCLALTAVSLLSFSIYSQDAASYLSDRLRVGPSPSSDDRPSSTTSHGKAPHPIDDLIKQAGKQFRRVLEKKSTTLEQAAARYRERRGRHPPPGFDTWFEAALKDEAIIVEDFFDRIHHDINPLWALDPLEMRKRTRNQQFVIRIRDGKAKANKDESTPFDRLHHWTTLVEEIMPHIPDLDMAVNHMDESRVLVPWEKMAEYMAKEQQMRKLTDADEVITTHSGLGDAAHFTEAYDPGWIRADTRKFWDYLKVACPPDSPGRGASAIGNFNGPIEYPLEPVAAFTYKGYVQNFTASKDPCLQPHLRGMHGTFVESISMATTHELLPLFAESKLPQNNELLIPGAVYLDTARATYSGGGKKGAAWAKKKNAMVWRGGASGARNKEDQWWHMHRNRFVQMLNGTTVAAAEVADDTQARSFQLLPADTYDVPAQQQGKLGPWVSKFSDVGFTDLLCDPPDFSHHWWYGDRRLPSCGWLAPWFSIAKNVEMKKQFDYKFLPDVDGNSYSGRYRAFLLSTSLPLKSTIYVEWLDDRLFPWLHFVPFDNSFMDIYAIMDYFLDGHDAQAETIAAEGKTWAQSVLRREDMKLYVWRLLLEYARVVDDNRERLGFVGDLKKQP